MKTKIAIGMFAISALVAGCGSKKHDDGADYTRVRPKVLIEAAQRESSGMVLLIGDSISERSGIHHLCGHDVFNAGISWAKLSDVEELAPSLTKMLQPSHIFVAIGSNDARTGKGTDVASWSAHYIALLQKLAPIPVTVLPAPEIEIQKSGAQGFDRAHLDALVAELPKIAKAGGATLLQRPSVETSDGVHPSAAGASAWRSDLAQGCDAGGHAAH